MADSLLLLKRVPSRHTWLRARKARPQLILSRRPRRRLRNLRWRSRRRLRRRLLQAQAAGADWLQGGCLVSGAAALRRLKTSARRRASSPEPAEDPVPSGPAILPIPPVRPAGSGRAVLLLPLGQVFGAAAATAAKSLQSCPTLCDPIDCSPPGSPVPEILQGFTFSGICRVTCLYGQVQVFGFTISQGQPAQNVFSTYTHSRLTINAVHYSVHEKSKKEMKREARVLLRPYLNQDDRYCLMSSFSPLCSIVLLERLKTSTVNFIISHPGLSYIFVQEVRTFQINSEYFALRSVGIRREKKKTGLRLTESAFAAVEELVSISSEEADSCPVILVCGCQDIGKSTFNRYLINQLLNSISCVDYLECDLGQTEFTPPGCISLLNITEPVLGPPFTHQRTPQKMVYYGKTSCKNNFENYIEVIKYVFSSYKRESPLIINTMGWVADQGLLLLIDLIRLLSPSHVVQFSSDRSKYMPDLTPDFVDDMDGLYTRRRSRVRNRGFHLPEFAESLEFADEEKESPVMSTGYKLMFVKSEFVTGKTSRNRESHNRVLRELAVLGYLSQLQPPVPKPLRALHGLTPYQVPFNAVALRIIHADVAPTHILYAVNASWVGLCKILDDVRGYASGPILLAQSPICDCVGFGICRGIDMEKRLYHILTPVPPEELRHVNCLLVGAVSIPQCVLKSQGGLEGTIPYVTTDYNFKLPGASEKIGARESGATYKERGHPKPKFYRKTY